jgi:hypothetical protein
VTLLCANVLYYFGHIAGLLSIWSCVTVTFKRNHILAITEQCSADKTVDGEHTRDMEGQLEIQVPIYAYQTR